MTKGINDFTAHCSYNRDMLFILFVSLAILGAVLLLTLTLFSHRDRGLINNSEIERDYAALGEYGMKEAPGTFPAASPEEKGHVPEVLQGESDIRRDEAGAGGPGGQAEMKMMGEGASEKGRSVIYIPVLPAQGPIPGVRASELIHYKGTGAYYSVDDQRDPGDMEIDISALKPSVEGSLVLTTKHVVVFNENVAKTIATYTVDKYHFHSDLLVLKKKRVKLKRDVVRIDADSERFRATLQALISHG